MSWKSSKQDTVVGTTTEAEYIVATSAAKEVVWIKKFISELDIVPSIVDPLVSIVITMVLSHKLRSLDLTNDPNTYFGVIPSFER